MRALLGAPTALIRVRGRTQHVGFLRGTTAWAVEGRTAGQLGVPTAVCGQYKAFGGSRAS
jgi:hypothetical protein